ncbi:MAG TPA: DUF3888 domain-containing protein [Virgibacillus sp.]|nr:DUF3888 domain-containing protein [Virgibacillus sp.]
MKKLFVPFIIVISLLFGHTTVYSQTINVADTELCDTLKYALIGSLRKPIDQAIAEIYQDDEEAPDDLTWASYQTQILKIKQVGGIGGTYEISLKVLPYYEAHNTYGEDIVIVSSTGDLISYEHIETYSQDNN